MSEPTRTALRYDLAAANVQLESLNMECRRLDIYMGLTTLTKVTRFTNDDEMLKKISDVQTHAHVVHQRLRKLREAQEQTVYELRGELGLPQLLQD